MSFRLRHFRFKYFGARQTLPKYLNSINQTHLRVNASMHHHDIFVASDSICQNERKKTETILEMSMSSNFRRMSQSISINLCVACVCVCISTLFILFEELKYCAKKGSKHTEKSKQFTKLDQTYGDLKQFCVHFNKERYGIR